MQAYTLLGATCMCMSDEMCHTKLWFAVTPQLVSFDPDLWYPSVLPLVVSLCPPLALLAQQVTHPLRVVRSCCPGDLACDAGAALGGLDVLAPAVWPQVRWRVLLDQVLGHQEPSTATWLTWAA
jgi:hypothetical protein